MLDPKQFSFTKQSDMDPSEDGHGHAPGQGGIPVSGVSLRTTKPTWTKKTNSTSVSILAFFFFFFYRLLQLMYIYDRVLQDLQQAPS